MRELCNFCAGLLGSPKTGLLDNPDDLLEVYNNNKMNPTSGHRDIELQRGTQPPKRGNL